jgi:hypothetical protein
VFADGDLAFLVQRGGIEHDDFRRAPHRHVQRAAVRREHAGVRFGLELRRRRDLPLGDVDRAHFLAVDLRGIQALAVRAERHAGHVPGVLDDVAAGMTLGCADRNRSRRRHLAILERVLVDDVLAGAGHEEACAVRMPHQTEPRVIDVRPGDDLQRVRIEDRERRLAPAAARDGEEPAARRRHEIHRQAADFDVPPGRRQPPSVGQQRDALALISGPHRARRFVRDERRERGGAHDASKSDQNSCSFHTKSIPE